MITEIKFVIHTFVVNYVRDYLQKTSTTTRRLKFYEKQKQAFSYSIVGDGNFNVRIWTGSMQ